jgi:hypothetical protein
MREGPSRPAVRCRFVRRVLDRLPEGVIAFGKTVGFVINYSPDQAVRLDRNGQPIEILDKAVRPATAVLYLGRHPITAEALGWFSVE